MQSRNPDMQIIVDAIYDDDQPPAVADLANIPAINRPNVGLDNQAGMASHKVVQKRKDRPSDLKIADLDKHPYCNAGRLNVHWSSANKDVHGSAQFVAPSILLTAAHCVHWAGQWNRNLYFLRRFERSSSDEPVFKIGKVGLLSGWIDNTQNAEPIEEAWAYDFAFLKIVGTSVSSHTPLVALTDEIQAMTTLGYPAKYDDGQIMLYSDGRRVQGEYESTVGLNPSHMGFGASGGAWFVRQSDNSMVIGLNSFKMHRDPNTDYSPVLGGAALSLLERMTELQ